MSGRHIFRGLALRGARPPRIHCVVADSRRAGPGTAFVAAAEGRRRSEHVAAACAAGVEAVIAESPCPEATLFAPCARWAAARSGVAARELDRVCPPLLGVTGTDGKTTVAWYTWVCLGAAGARVGTLGFHDGRRGWSGPNTTPGAEALHDFLAGLDTGCPGVALEVSSHAIDQHRLAGLRLAGLVVTGIGSDHLDYHRSHAAYVATKLRAARLLAPGGLGIVAADDPRASSVVHALRAAGGRPLHLGLERGDSRVVRAGDGWVLEHAGGSHDLPVALPGGFNAWNAAAGALLAGAAGVPLATALARLAAAPPVPGRLERVLERPLAYVDYAHTPGAVALVLDALRRAHPERRLVCVVGCGGDRDRGKRPLMARAALAADRAVFTSDNPRGEPPAAIIDDMLTGLDPVARAAVVVEPDRAAALALALELAGRGGVVAVCGKGHETVQVIGEERLAFDDRAVLRRQGDVA